MGDKDCAVFFKIEAQLVYNVVLVSGVRHGGSVIHIYYFSDSFPL